MIWSIPKPTGLYSLREARIRLVGWTHMAYALALRIASFLNISMEVHIKYFSTHAMHVWYIYLHLLDFYDKCRWIYNTWMLWVSMGFILVLHWHYKYVVTVCYEKHGVNKLEKLWRKVIALNIGLIREQARRWDHSWMELSDFDMFYNIQSPIKLDNVLFCVFWILFLKPSNVLHQSAVFSIILSLPICERSELATQIDDGTLGRLNDRANLIAGRFPSTFEGPQADNRVPPRALRVIVHKEKASLCLVSQTWESPRRVRHQNFRGFDWVVETANENSYQ